jgi:hypothetical protein
MRWVGQMSRTEEKKNLYKAFVGSSEKAIIWKT